MKYAERSGLRRLDGLSLQILIAASTTLKQWNYRDLRAPYWRLYWNRSAGATIRTTADEVEIVPEKIYLIPPETNFSTQLVKPSFHFYIHFLTKETLRSPQICHLEATSELQSQILLLSSADPSAAHPWRLAAFLTQVLALIPKDDWLSPFAPASETISRALRYLESHLPFHTPVKELARFSGMNLNAFIRLFKAETGKTPARFQKERRIAWACSILHHSNEKIDSIAEDCGFCDRHHFTRVFTAVRGISPAAFRRRAALTYSLPEEISNPVPRVSLTRS